VSACHGAVDREESDRNKARACAGKWCSSKGGYNRPSCSCHYCTYRGGLLRQGAVDKAKADDQRHAGERQHHHLQVRKAVGGKQRKIVHDAPPKNVPVISRSEPTEGSWPTAPARGVMPAPAGLLFAIPPISHHHSRALPERNLRLRPSQTCGQLPSRSH